jgi:two-component system, response regulator
VSVKESVHVEILLIEDNPDDAGLVARALKKENLVKHLLHFRNGEEALNYLLMENIVLPKLIILDLKMPLVDGFDVLKNLKSNDRLKIIPIVVLTSSREYRDILQAYNLGANAYLVKPVDFNRFSEMIYMIASFWIKLNQSPIF